MENSTKALIMAAGVLIGILILTAFIMVFRKGGQMLESLDSKKTIETIEEYNSKLIIYNRTGELNNYNTIFDVITAWNFAYNINEENLNDPTNCLEVEIRDRDDSLLYELTFNNPHSRGYADATTKLTDLIQIYGQLKEPPSYEYEYRFSGETIVDHRTGKIVRIIFKLIY